jgi:opacity protein-like surface antigen
LTGLDFSKGFAHKWEAGIHASVYHSYQSSVVDYGVGIDLGLNVRDNMWVTLGYNISGFYDDDFSGARYTAQGPYLRVSIKADQETLKRIAGR